MNDTPSHLYEIAASMKGEGSSLRSIIYALLDEGATDLDLLRVVRRMEGASLKRARELLDETELVSSTSGGVVIIVPEGDPWYEDLIAPRSEESASGD